MAGRPFNTRGNFQPRRTPCFKGRQSCRDQDVSGFRGHSCQLSDEDEFSGWRKKSSGFQNRSMWAPPSNGECVINRPSRLNMLASNRDSRSFSPSYKEDNFISEVHRQEQPIKYRRLEWVNPRRRVDSSTPHCDVPQNAGISDKEAPCNQRHPKRPIRSIYREPGFPSEARMQRLTQMSNKEYTAFRGHRKGKAVSTNQASRWMYANEHGQISGPYSLNQLSEGLNNGFLPKNLPVHRLCHGDLDEPVPLKSLFEKQGNSHFPYSEETLNNENSWSYRQQAHSHWDQMQSSSCGWCSPRMGDEFCSENNGPSFLPQRGHPSMMYGLQPFDEANHSPSACFDGERSETSDRDGSVPPGFEAGVNGRTSFETSFQHYSGVTTAEGTHCWEMSSVHDAFSNGGSNVSHHVDGFAAHDVVGRASVDMGCRTNNQLDAAQLSGYDSPIRARTSCIIPDVCIGIPVNIPGAANWNAVTEAVCNDSPTSMNSLARSNVLGVPCSLDQGTGKSIPEEAGLNQCGRNGGKIEESADVIKLNAIMLVRKELLAAVKRSYCRTILSALISESLGLVDREFVASKNLFTREEVPGTKAATNKPEATVNGDLNSAGAASLSQEPSGLNNEGFGRVGFEMNDGGKLVSKDMLDKDGSATAATAAAASPLFKGILKDFAKPSSANIVNSIDDMGKGAHPLHLEKEDRQPVDVFRLVNADEGWKGNFKLVLPYLLQAQKLLLELDKSGSSSADMTSNVPLAAQSEALALIADGHRDESNVGSSTEKTVLAALQSLCSKQ